MARRPWVVHCDDALTRKLCETLLAQTIDDLINAYDTAPEGVLKTLTMVFYEGHVQVGWRVSYLNKTH